MVERKDQTKEQQSPQGYHGEQQHQEERLGADGRGETIKKRQICFSEAWMGLKDKYLGIQEQEQYREGAGVDGEEHPASKTREQEGDVETVTIRE